MIPDVEAYPPRSTHQEILEEEHTRAYHAIDVFPICNCIVAIGKDTITRGKFEEDTPHMTTLQAILGEI